MRFCLKCIRSPKDMTLLHRPTCATHVDLLTFCPATVFLHSGRHADVGLAPDRSRLPPGIPVSVTACAVHP